MQNAEGTAPASRDKLLCRPIQDRKIDASQRTKPKHKTRRVSEIGIVHQKTHGQQASRASSRNRKNNSERSETFSQEHKFLVVFGRTIPVIVFADNESLSSPMSPRQLLWPELLFRFGFEALVMNRARSLIGRGDLTRDLFAERHAGHKMRRVHRLIGGRGLPRPGR